MQDIDFKEKILNKLYAAHLTALHQYPNQHRGRFSGLMDEYFSNLFSVPQDKVLELAKELEKDGLIEIVNWDNKKKLTLSGLGIQRRDFTEKIEQMKSTMMIEMVATIIEKDLKEVDPKDEINWKKRIVDTSQKILTKAAEFAIGAVIKSSTP